MPPVTVGQANELHLPEHRGQQAAVISLDRPVRRAVDIDDIDALLLGGTQTQVVLEQAAQHLPAPDRQLILQITVVESGRLGTVEPPDDLLEGLPGGRERHPVATTIGGHDRPRPPLRRCLRAAKPSRAADSRSSRAAS